jgi:hypothetical protein
MKKRWLVWSMAAAAFGLIVAVLALVRWLQHKRWVEALQDEAPAIRAAAVRGLPPDGNEQLLIDRLADEDADVRLLAAEGWAAQAPKEPRGPEPSSVS